MNCVLHNVAKPILIAELHRLLGVYIFGALHVPLIALS